MYKYEDCVTQGKLVENSVSHSVEFDKNDNAIFLFQDGERLRSYNNIEIQQVIKKYGNKLEKKYRFEVGQNVKSPVFGCGVVKENLGNYLYLVDFNGEVKTMNESYIDFA